MYVYIYIYIYIYIYRVHNTSSQLVVHHYRQLVLRMFLLFKRTALNSPGSKTTRPCLISHPVHIYIYIYVYVYVYVFICIYIYVYIYLCKKQHGHKRRYERGQNDDVCLL